MTWDEWKEAVAWLEASWPNNPPWPAQTVRSTFEQVRRFDGANVFAAAHQWFADGHHWPPTPSELVATARTISREQAMLRPKRPALPDGDQPLSFGEYLSLRGFKSFEEAVAAQVEKP